MLKEIVATDSVFTGIVLTLFIIGGLASKETKHTAIDYVTAAILAAMVIGSFSAAFLLWSM